MAVPTNIADVQRATERQPCHWLTRSLWRPPARRASQPMSEQPWCLGTFGPGASPADGLTRARVRQAAVHRGTRGRPPEFERTLTDGRETSRDDLQTFG